MEEKETASNEGSTEKRGRKKKNLIDESLALKDKNKFFIDVSKDSDNKDLIQNLINQANSKSYGREIILKDLVLAALPKLTSKDIERIQENSLTEMEKVERALDDYNKKSELKLSLGEYLVKKLGIN